MQNQHEIDSRCKPLIRQDKTSETEKYCTSAFVLNRLSWSYMTLHRYVTAGLFPKPALVIRRRRYWKLSDVLRFEVEHAVAEDKKLSGDSLPAPPR